MTYAKQIEDIQGKLSDLGFCFEGVNRLGNTIFSKTYGYEIFFKAYAYISDKKDDKDGKTPIRKVSDFLLNGDAIISAENIKEVPESYLICKKQYDLDRKIILSWNKDKSK